MAAVGDELHRHVVSTARAGQRQAGLAVGAGAHGIEEVRHRPRAAVERAVGLGGGRVGVPAGDGHPARDELVDELQRARALRGEGHVADRARV